LNIKSNRDIEKYSKTINSTFVLDRTVFILSLNLENFIEIIEKLYYIYMEKTTKEIKDNSEFIMQMY